MFWLFWFAVGLLCALGSINALSTYNPNDPNDRQIAYISFVEVFGIGIIVGGGFVSGALYVIFFVLEYLGVAEKPFLRFTKRIQK